MADGVLRTVGRMLRDAGRLRYLELRRPERVRVGGVLVEVDRGWAPAVRRDMYAGWYEGGERWLLGRTLRPDDRYLELGAGAGVVAAIASRVTPHVVAYEANPAMAAAAAETLRRNGSSAEVINAVLGDDDGEATLYVHDEFWRSSLDPAAGGTPQPVPMRSFDTELARLQPTYLMVDIEGGEVKLLSGRSLPPCVRALGVEIHPHVVGNRAIQEMLVSLARDGFVLDMTVSGTEVLFLEREGAIR